VSNLNNAENITVKIRSNLFSVVVMLFFIGMGIFNMLKYKDNFWFWMLCTFIFFIAFLGVFRMFVFYRAIFDSKSIRWGLFRKVKYKWTELTSIEILDFFMGETTNYVFKKKHQFLLPWAYTHDYDKVNAMIRKIIKRRKLRVAIHY
jgi:hypothetical protein